MRSSFPSVTLAALLMCALAPERAQSQRDSTSSSLGIASVGALTAYLGGANVDFAEGTAIEGGLGIDLGWLRTPRIRLIGDVEYLRGRVFAVDSLRDVSKRGPFSDLSANVSLMWLAHASASRFTPYIVAGAGVHILSSRLGVQLEDFRYNANRFGLQVAAGSRIRLSSEGRTGAFFELRRALVSDVNRTSARAGAVWFFGDLVRSQPR